MSAADAWCGNCGAHLVRCACGVALRNVMHEEPTSAQWEAIAARRFPSTKAVATQESWRRYVDNYIRDMKGENPPAVVSQGGRGLGGVQLPHYDYGPDGKHHLAAALNDVRERRGLPSVPFGTARSSSGEPVQVHLADDGVRIVLPDGKAVTVERKEASQLARLIEQAATFRRAREI